MALAIPDDLMVKIKENKKRRQVLRTCQKIEKALEQKGDDDFSWNWPT